MMIQGKTRALEIVENNTISGNQKYINDLIEKNGKMLVDGVEYALLCDPQNTLRDPFTFKTLAITLDQMDDLGPEAYIGFNEYDTGFYMLTMSGSVRVELKRGRK